MSNSGRMAISATFAEDGKEPDLSPLLHSSVFDTMHVYKCACTCTSECVHTQRKGEILQHLPRIRGCACFSRCVCVRGEGVVLADCLCDQKRVASKCMQIVVINITAVPFGYANVF